MEELKAFGILRHHFLFSHLRNLTMQPNKLFVIGNGFDLHHGIPSRFSNFRNFVENHDTCVFDAVEEYLPVAEGWADLEAALADVDPDQITDDLGHFAPSYSSDDWSDSGHHDFQYEVDKLVERLSTDLRSLFAKWIRQLQIPDRNQIMQPVEVLDPTGAFLSFNYTGTLTQTYGIPRQQILYIHGYAEMAEDELILGHAWRSEDRRSLNDRQDVTELDTRLVEVHEILDDYFSKTFKPSDKLIQQHAGFFEWLSDIQDVHLLGHSLSKIDAPYFDAMLRVPAVRQARFHLAISDFDDEVVMVARLIALGVPAHQIQPHPWT
ncbi:bacteriophage abortive infection AbiH family protein [Xanthomonas campestris]|uniref:bacteriophage abortive infection AbiH family protein n=1 Tax=Xanthomonas campestris TaxID=339 RepID=UPI0021F7AD5B|nr:bacteriophage abortive infection AbiH family protein [Xanthomonas campestris]MEB1942258.1 bacteriophage abortive infection AbiH family protein [Xanthomonas campestris pv. campestris]UYP76584.1 bacteriophage abortive infection AbiH family protein [Xanthomonas campestris pv. campestris]